MKRELLLLVLPFCVACGTGEGGTDSHSSASTEINTFNCTDSEIASEEEVPLDTSEDLVALEEDAAAEGKSLSVVGKAEFPSVVVTADCGSVVQVDFQNSESNSPDSGAE